MFDENFMKNLARTARAENFSTYKCFHPAFIRHFDYSEVDTKTVIVVFYDKNDNIISKISCLPETLRHFGVI